MVSLYGYTTVAALELYAIIDYGVTDASFVDAAVEGNISQAERYVNIHCGTSFTAPLPDAIVAVTNELSRRLMHNNMVNQGIGTDSEGKALKLCEIVIDAVMEKLLEKYVVKDKTQGGVDIIPMVRNQFMRGY